MNDIRKCGIYEETINFTNIGIYIYILYTYYHLVNYLTVSHGKLSHFVAR